MGRHLMPRNDAHLTGWSFQLATRIASDPERYGVPQALADELVTLQAAYGDLALRASNLGDRTQSMVIARNTAREAMAVCVRRVAMIARAQPGVSSVDLVNLGLHVPADGAGAPIAPPDAGPVVRVARVDAATVTVRLSEAGRLGRGRPKDAAGAVLFTAIEDAAGTDALDWRFHSMTSKTTARLQMPMGLPIGTRVHVRAFWFNAKSERSPFGAAVSTWTTGGVNNLAA